MTTYYVDFVNGLDANNGLGPDASAGTNKPWKTITKLLGAAGMSSGDTAYLAPVAFREVVTPAMTSATVETKIIGDPHNAQGFKTSGGVRLSPGEVRLTAYTTNDTTAASASTLISFNQKDFLTFQNITFVAGSGNPALFNAGGDATNITFTDCAFVGYWQNVSQMTIGNTTALAMHWLFDRCRFFLPGNVVMTFVRHLTADYDVDVVFRNCSGVIYGQFSATTSGANTFNPGGVLWIGCSFFIPGNPSISILSNMSTTIPCKIENSVIFGANNISATINCAVAGQLTEQFNIIYSNAARGGNVSAGTGSISNNSYAPGVHFGQERITGAAQRHWLEPTLGSPFLGFGSSASAQSVDGLNQPRPAGGLSASKTVGAFERGNTWGQETGTVHTGSNALSITGPGFQDFDLAVDTTATTVSVWMRFDATYAGTKPVMSVLNGLEAGVADATTSAVTTVSTWEQLSLTFTPTSAGVVTIRLTSTDTNGGGKAFADDLAVV